ncbi:mobile mystery protein A [Ekhidna sp.]|uniref:mobile mystery protein A n=1 Tax=Ekhidna sp. TaxID=2608089 RepID=UPI003510D901
MKKQQLQIEQLDRRLKGFQSLQDEAIPSIGWIKAIRTALGISLQQMANKLSITKQSAAEIEQREIEETITLKSLREAAIALDMNLVYGFVPKDGSLDHLIDRKARELATKIVSRTSTTMKLEDQENSEQRIRKAIEQRADELKREVPKILWD